MWMNCDVSEVTSELCVRVYYIISAPTFAHRSQTDDSTGCRLDVELNHLIANLWLLTCWLELPPQTGLRLDQGWIETGLKLVWDWIETGSKLNWDWIEAGLKLDWDWIETGSRLDWGWIETGLRLDWNWIETGLRLMMRALFPRGLMSLIKCAAYLTFSMNFS